ncbi:MAG: hypothetical protein Q4C70_08550, partial [Planctomycetia bacterium]|nr:hypothetical protein [Planctomycetia bacterium]
HRWGELLWSRYFSPSAPSELRLNSDAGCIVGGLSFGGMISPFIGDVFQQHGIPVHCGIRLATVRYGNQIPASYAFRWNLLNCLPCGGWRIARLLAVFYLRTNFLRRTFARDEMCRQLVRSPARRCHRVLKMIANWRENEISHDFPIVQIHGTHDGIIPFSLVKSPEVIRLETGHMMTLTRPMEVNREIQSIIRKRSHSM